MNDALIDVNVNLSRWPFRRVRDDDTRTLVGTLREHGVTEAWAGSFDGLLHKDVAGVNERLADECGTYGRGLLRPFGSVNPMLPDWEEDLRRCAKVHAMPGIRLHPNYHGYGLDHPNFQRLLGLARDSGLIVQLVVAMEDERMMHPLLRVPNVDVPRLEGTLRAFPGVRVVLLNALRSVSFETLREIIEAGEVYVDIGMLEGVCGIERLASQIPVERVLFGSHSPLFYFESAMLKLKESELDEAQSTMIRGANAMKLLSSR